MDMKTIPYICCLQETYLRSRDTYRLKVRGQKLFHANGNHNKAGIPIFISDNIDFKIKTVIRVKEGYYITTKESIQEEDITIVNIYGPKIGAPQYIRQILRTIKGEINNNTLIVGNFNSLVLSMDRSSRQKIKKETQILNDTLDQIDLIYIYRALHPKREEYTFFSSAHGAFCRIDHILGHKASLSKFKKLEIIPNIFSDHKAMRLEMEYKKKKTIKNTNMWRLNNMILHNECITENIKDEIKNC